MERNLWAGAPNCWGRDDISSRLPDNWNNAKDFIVYFNITFIFKKLCKKH